MKNIIIYAHPNTGGHCFEILQEIKNKLEENKQEYKLYDLYDLKYDPVLHENELYTAGNHEVSELNQEIQKEITQAENLIFIYPIWWGSMPAIMKGFIDRIFVSNYAFKYENMRPVGLLKNKKAAVFITSGAPKLFHSLFMGNRIYKSIRKDILRFCGIKSKIFHLDMALELNKKNKHKIKKLVIKGLTYLQS